MRLHVGIDANHIFHLALLRTRSDQTRVQVVREKGIRMAFDRGVEKLHGNSKGMVFRQDIALQFARLEHELAGFLHPSVANPLLFERFSCFDDIVGARNKQLDQRAICIFVRYYPTAKHI